MTNHESLKIAAILQEQRRVYVGATPGIEAEVIGNTASALADLFTEANPHTFDREAFFDAYRA